MHPISYAQAVVLGLLQGAAELFPVSSLGHSVIAPKLLGWDKRVGTLSAGKWADVVAVPGDPTRDITVMEKPTFVMKGGVVYKQQPAAKTTALR